MRRFRVIVEENLEQLPYISEYARRVSSRTLRICRQEHLGMGPKRYLLLNRLHLARRVLREAAPDTTSVADIAMRHGFWRPGHFADDYRALFGETPSATLRK